MVATALFSLAVLVGGSAWASSSGPISPFPITGAYSAQHTEDRNHVSIIEFSGNYDKDLDSGDANVEPRAVIAQEFYRSHPDNYDFLVVFSTFEFETGDAVAFHWGVQNQVQGINLPTFDVSELFGSTGKLKGFIDMAALTRYETNPLKSDFDYTLSVLAHEVLHQWGPRVRFMDSDNTLSDALIGHEGAHWSYLLDSDASVEYGADWKDNGDGTFTSMAITRFFNPLDLYLMGYYKPEEVPPFYLIENSELSKYSLPQENVTISGTKREITIDDIIAAEGPRIPSADEAQHDYRFAFILLTGQGETVTDQQILALNHVRQEFMTRFAILTGGRGIAQVYPEALPIESTGTAEEVTGGTIRSTSASLEDGLVWLSGQQESDGSWSDKEATRFRDTIAALDTLSKLDLSFTGQATALSWLEEASADQNLDYLARYATLRNELGLSSYAQLTHLAKRQNTDGGWGLGDGYASTVLDTALALKALAPGSGSFGTAIEQAVGFLAGKRNPDGGWSGADGGPSRTGVTVTVLLALQAVTGESAIDMTQSLAWIADKQNADGGFGDSPSTVHDTANVLNALITLEATDQIRATDAVDYLMTTQTDEGSWVGSAYATALAVSTLKRFNFPNWAVDPVMLATPETPRDGDRVEVRISVRNDSHLATPAGILRLFVGDPDVDGVQVGDDMVLPLLAPNEGVELTRLWDTYDMEGERTLVALVDPDDAQQEMSESDNRAEYVLTVASAPAGVDLAVETTDISVSPAQPDTLPSTLALSVSVRNTGITDASDVLVQVWQGNPGEGELVGEDTLNILGRSSVAVNHTYTLTTPGSSTFNVVLDPDNNLLEEDETNNIASATISTVPTIDLAVSAGDITISDNPAYVGDDITFTVNIHNQGTLDAPSAIVLFQVTDGSTTEEIQSTSVQVDAGQTVSHNVIWRVDMEGSLVFSAQLDTSGLVPETNEENNSATASLSAGLASGPNLAVDYRTFTFTPTPALEGQDLQLSAEVSNTGADSASNIEVAFYNGDPDGGGTQIGASQTIATLDSGDSTTVSVVWTNLDDSLDKLLFVVVDPQDQITEFYEEDNSAFNTLSVESLPDLATSAGDLMLSPAFPKVGETVTLTVRVSNLGQQSAEEVVVRAFDGDPSDGGVSIGSDQTIASLAGLFADTVQFSWTLSTAGTARPVVVQVDPAGAIQEQVTSNNNASRHIAAQDGDFYVTEPYISPNGDGVKESTHFFFRLQSEANVSVVVVNSQEETVRELTSDEFRNTSGANVLWDGLDELGRLVDDGKYRLRVLDENAVLLGQASVTVDTNQSPILDSLDTPYQSFTNLTCDITSANLLKVTDDENSIIFYNSDEPAGIYRMGSNGTDVSPIILRDTLGGDSIYYIHASDDGETIIFMRGGSSYTNTLYVIDTVSETPRTVSLPESSLRQVLGISPDGTKAFIFTNDGLYAVPTDGVSAPVLLYTLSGQWLSDFKQSNNGRYVSIKMSTGLIVADTWNNSSVLIESTGFYYSEYAWSPDNQRIAVSNPELWRMDLYSPQGSLLQSIDFPWSAESIFDVTIGEPQWSLSGTQFAVRISFNSNCEDSAGKAEKPGGIVVFDTVTNTSEAAASLEPGIPGCFSYHVSTWDGTDWVERGELHYGLRYREQSLPLREYLPDPDGEYKVRIRQTGLEAAHVDQVALSADGMSLLAVSATNTATGEDMLAQVIHPDYEVQDLHEAEMEVHWSDVPPVAVSLSLLAREEELSSRNAVPFSYPEQRNSAYSYALDGRGPLTIDGEATAEDHRGKPLFEVFSKPDTGHPPAHVYGYVSSDDNYLYGALDFTVDNTIDGDRDWGALWVRSASGWREFRVSETDTQWGIAGFTRTEKVHYRHKYYEFRVPLAELGASVGDTLDVRFEAYGTAAILIGEDDDYLPLHGDLLWAPGDETLIYETSYEGSWAIFLDQDNRLQELLPDWSYRPRNLRFVPSGRQLLFDSGEAAYDSNSVCYSVGWSDSWSFKSLLNLTADVRAIRSSQSGGIKLSGTATDLNFDSYQLEYASVDTPESWSPIAPASGQSLVDDEFTTWVPPGPGAYFVRLTVTDLAGNERRFVNRVYWSDTPSITDLYRTPRYISPNGDGMQDEAAIHYRILEPVHLEFNIYNGRGDLIRTLERDHALVGAEFDLLWDGRDSNGLLVADGEYRLVVQNYEFAITVDSTSPSLSLIKNNAFQEYCDDLGQTCIVTSSPSISWSITEKELSKVDFEKSDDFSTATWLETIDLTTDFEAEQQDGTFFLSLVDLASAQYRLSAQDLAGNQTTIYASDAEEEVFIERFGNHSINPRMDECIDPLDPAESPLDPERVTCAKSIGGYYASLKPVLYNAMTVVDGVYESSGIVSSGDIRFLVKESTVSEIVQTFVQYKPLGSATWLEEPATAYLDGLYSHDGGSYVPATEIDRPNDSVAHILWRPEGLNGGGQFVIRLRVIDELGNEHYSNVFSFLTSGYSFNGLVPSPLEPVYKSKIEPILPEGLNLSDLFDEWFLWGEQFIGNEVATVDLYVESEEDPRYVIPNKVASVSHPGETFLFRTKELQACRDYKGFIVLKGEEKLDGTSDEIGRTQGLEFSTPCLQLDVSVETAFAESCGDPSPNKLTISLTPEIEEEVFTTGGSELKLLTLFTYDESDQEDVVFNVNKPENKKTYLYEIDTTHLDEEHLSYYARVINEDDDVFTRPVEIIIDHTPPTIEFTYPLEGQKVCGVQKANDNGVLFSTVQLEGTGYDANGFHHEVDVNAQLVHLSRDGGLSRTFDSFSLYPRKSDSLPHSEFHLGPNESGALAQVIDEHGYIEANIRVFDHGGFQQCTTLTFEVDGEAELYGVSLSQAVISPNGDSISDSLDINYSVGESGYVDVRIYQAYYDSFGKLQLASTPLKTIIAGTPVLPGSASISWDGTDDSAAVVKDGLYAVEVVMRDGCDLSKRSIKTVEVDTTPPEVDVAYPNSGDPLSMMVEIIGSINDAHFQNYVVRYGAGHSPENWAIVGTETQSVDNGVIASWNTYGLSAEYALRITAQDTAGNQREVTILLDIEERSELIQYLEPQPRVFSPNDDGRRESTSIRLGLDEDVMLTVKVMDETQLIRTLTDNQAVGGGSLVLTWDGRDDTGEAVLDGTYQLQVSASSVANPLLTQDEQVILTVDNTAPQVELLQPDNGFIDKAGALMGNISDIHLTSYRIDLQNKQADTSWQEISAGSMSRLDHPFAQLSALEEGQYALQIEAQDEAENKTVVSFDFVIDDTPPDVTLNSLEHAVLGAANGPHGVTGAITEENLEVYGLHYGAGVEPTSWSELAAGITLPLADPVISWDVSVLSDGDYVLELSAADKAGLENNDRLAVVIDNTPPLIQIDGPAEGGYINEATAILGSVSDANFSSYQVDIAPGAKGTSNRWSLLGTVEKSVQSATVWNWQALPPDGLYTLRIKATDAADNTSEKMTEYVVDTTPPAIPTGLTFEVVSGNEVHLSWNANTEADLAGYHVYRDGGRLTADPITNTTFIDSAVLEGRHQYTISATDHAGWESDPTEAVGIVIDLTPPAVKLTVPGDSALVKGYFDIEGTAYSVDDFKEYRLFIGQGSNPSDWQLLRQSPVPTIADVLAQWNTVVLPEGSQYSIRLEAEDINGNQAHDQITVVVDNQPPAAPLGLSATLSGSDVTLTWNPNSETDLLGYLVFRDDRLVNALGAAVGDLRPYVMTNTGYGDTALPDGSYDYTLIAIDEAGNLSDASDSVTVDIDTHAPHAVIVTPQEAKVFDNSLYIQAETEDQDVDQVQFQYRIEGASVWETLGSPDTGVPFEVYLDPVDLGLAHGSYEIQALATDYGGQTDPSPTPVNVTYKDLTRPATVLGVQAVIDGGTVTLTWDANTESDLLGYYVDRTLEGGSPVRITVTPTSETTYIDSGLADGQYAYTVVAIDSSDNEADRSETANAQVYTPVLNQPFTPVSVLISDFTGSTDIDGNQTVQAQLINDAGSGDLDTITVDADGVFTYQEVALEEGLNRLRITVSDDAGNRSKPAEAGIFSGQAPSVPTGVNATAVDYEVDVSWNVNPESTLAGYRVFRDGSLVLGEETAAISTVTASSYYSGRYPSYATDSNTGTYWSPIRSNEMPLSGQWIALELDSASQVSGLRINWSSLSYRAADFRIQAWNAEVGAWITLFEVLNNQQKQNLIHLDNPYRSDQLRLVIDRSNLPETYYRAVRLAEMVVLHEPLLTETLLQETVADGVYQYTVTAVNELGFESEPSTSTEVAVGDVVAPDPVTLAATVDGADVTLEWTASSASDTQHYLIYRDDSLIATHLDLDTLEYVDAALPNGLYEYTVTVVDAVGNESLASNIAQATIAGMVPAVPQGLVVMAVAEGGALDLMWGSGTGGSATAYYEVMRSESSGGPYTVVASTTASNYRDTGLSNTIPYYYVIRAVDVLNNRSAQSEEGSGIPKDINAPPVWLHYPAAAGGVFSAHKPNTTIAGYSEPGALVKITNNGFNVGSASATSTQSEQVYSISSYSDSVTLSPNGRYAAYRGGQANVVVRDLLTQTQVEIPLASAYTDSFIAWSFDGQAVIFSDESTSSARYYIRRYELASQETVDLTNPDDGELNYAQLAPSAKQIAGFGEKDGQTGLWLVDISANTWTLLVDADLWRFNGRSLRWSPDGSRLSYQRTYPSWSVEIVHAATSALQILTSEAGVSVPQWSPDATDLVYVSVASGSSQVWHYDVSQGVAEAITTGGQHVFPAWGPGGQRIAYYATDENNTWSIAIRDLHSGVETMLSGDTQGSYEYPLQWTQSGVVGLYMYGEYHSLVPAGYFELQGIDLSEGDNVFYAEAVDESGNWSEPSEAITVIYDTSAFTDLSIASTDVRILPAAPQVGEPIRVTAIVHNPSDRMSPNAQLTIVAIDPVGTMTTLLDGQVLDPIQPAGSQAISADWLIGTDAGLYTLVVTVDAEGAVREASEVNNIAFSDFLVSEGGDISAQLSLASDQNILRADETLTVTAAVTNGGEPFTGQVSLRIEDQDGYLVETLLTQPVTGLSYGASQQVTAEWLPGSTFAGDYVAHALLSDSSGNTVDDATLSLRLLGSSEISASVSTDSVSYAPNTPLHVIGEYQYVAGNSILDGVNAVIQLRNEEDLVLTEESFPLGTLLPDSRGNVELYWNTGTSPAGQYTAHIEIQQDGYSLSQSQSTFTVELGDAQLVGEISISDALIGAGTPQTVQYTVSNISNALLTDQPLIVSLYDPDQQAILQTEQFTATIALASAFSGSMQIATDTLLLKGYTVVLQAELPDNDGQIKPVTLKTAQFKVVDRSLPLVRIDVPTDNDYLSADSPLTVYATDDLTRIVKVEAMIDGAAWKTLPMLNDAGSTWGEVLTGLTDGIHSVIARATDAAGNMSETPQAQFTLDTVDPEITVSGVEEWAHYNIDVTPVVTVADENPVTTLISLNGISFESDTVLSAEGSHRLAAQAKDAAGNIALYELVFEIDKTPPLVELTSPVDGAASSDTTTDVAGTAEPYTIVYLDTGSFQVSQLTAEDGAFLFEDTPLVMGANTITLYAEDRAGNTGPTVEVTVTRLPEIQATLEGTIVPTGEVLIWYPAKVKRQHPHKPDASDHHGYGEEDDEDSSSHSLCHELGVTKKRKRSIEISDDWKSHHYEDVTADPLLTMVKETLQSKGKPYHIAVDEHDFVEKLRTHRYSTVMFIDIMHKPIWEGYTHWHYHAQWPLSERAQEELLGTIASGTGLLWIKTHPGHGQALAHGLGMRIFGTSPHLNAISLPEGPATVAGDWEASGFGLSMRTQPGTAVGKLSPGSRPAMMISRHGNGNVAVMAFNPAMLTDQQAAEQILTRSLDFAVSIEVPRVPGIPIGIRWTTQQLIPPMELEFEQALPLDMEFVSALNGVIESDYLARWQGIVKAEQHDYEAVVILPDTLGTHTINGKLSELRDGLAWELVQGSLDVTVSDKGQDIAVELIDALNALDLRRRDARRRSAALWFIQLAVTKETDSLKDIEYAIRKLLVAQKFIASLDEVDPDIHRLLGQLLSVYQLAWIELRSQSLTSHLEPSVTLISHISMRHHTRAVTTANSARATRLS
jgi:subtilase family serine protease/fibronectin type 3 domain-containing protein